MGGLEYESRGRITYSVEIAWAEDLNHRDLHVVSGMPDDAEWREVRLIAAGGPVVGGSIGYAF